jgi:glycosyltransferase involved in cell wall biosynthesis
LWRTELYEQLGRRLDCPSHAYWKRISLAISKEAARIANRYRASLLLYEPYADYAFRSEYRHHTPKKVLFHFHPHPLIEREIYAQDRVRHPISGNWLVSDAGGLREPSGSEQVWKYADRILCASSFCKRSLVHAGADETRISVIPYGVDCVKEIPSRPPKSGFHAVFVGSGIQRKGLHTLLDAWRAATLPKGSKLTIIARTIDPLMEGSAARTPNVQISRGVTCKDLISTYRASDLLVVPSLVEGFGQVYLEALSQGCPVLGTPNTAVPDLGTEADGVFCVPASNVHSLVEMLERLSGELVGNLRIRERALINAKQFTWAKFRAGVVDALL